MIEQNLKNFKLKSRATYQKLVEEEQELQAELSALGDKFEAWASEPSCESSAVARRPPVGGRPPMGGGAKGANRQLGPLVGSARATSYSKRVGLAERQQSAPRMEGIEGQDTELSAEAMKILEIKGKMEQIDIDIVQNGGNNCGWDASDHKDFLRLHT